MTCVSRQWIPGRSPAPASAGLDLDAGAREEGKAQEAPQPPLVQPRPLPTVGGRLRALLPLPSDRELTHVSSPTYPLWQASSLSPESAPPKRPIVGSPL